MRHIYEADIRKPHTPMAECAAANCGKKLPIHEMWPLRLRYAFGARGERDVLERRAVWTAWFYACSREHAEAFHAEIAKDTKVANI